MKANKNAWGAVLFAALSGHGYAGNNPASIAYVNKLVADTITRRIYTAGNDTIIVSGTQISANYQAGSGIKITDNLIELDDDIPYVGQGAINIVNGPTQSTVFSNFQGSNGLTVDNGSATTTTGMVYGYDATATGSGLTISASTSSAPGSISSNLVAGTDILVSPSAVDTSIELAGNYSAGSGVVFSTGTSADPIEISAAYDGTNGLFVDDASGTVYGYTTGTGSGVTIGTSTTAQNGISAHLVAGTAILIDHASASGDTSINITSTYEHKLSELFEGGIIFYLDSSKTHGLAASIDQPPATAFNYDDFRLAAFSNGVYAGQLNMGGWMGSAGNGSDDNNYTAALFSTASRGVFADGSTGCSVTDALDGVNPNTGGTPCYGQWYIPSIYEMQLIFQNATSITDGGGTALAASGSPYWTSNTNTADTNNINGGTGVYVVSSATTAPVFVDRNSANFYYRPIRAF